MIDLTGGPCVYKRLSGCGSGTEYLAVTPWGDFYPCHQFVGQEDFCLGNVYEGVKKTETVNEFKNATFIPRRSAASALHGSTAAADARQTPTISQVRSTMFTRSDARCSRNGSSVH